MDRDQDASPDEQRLSSQLEETPQQETEYDQASSLVEGEKSNLNTELYITRDDKGQATIKVRDKGNISVFFMLFRLHLNIPCSLFELYLKD